jgi:peroxiredoxin
LAVVAVGGDDEEPAAKVARFARDLKANFPVLPGGGAAAEAYGVDGFPMTFLIDREGRIAGLVNGYDPKVLDKAVARLVR